MVTDETGSGAGSAPEIPVTAAQLLDLSPAAICAIDVRGVILAHNAALPVWVLDTVEPGGVETDLRGRNVVEWLSASARLLYETHMMPQLLATGEVWDAVLDVRDRTGLPRPVRCNATLHTGPDGSRVIYVVAADASERVAFERELVEARRRAHQATERLTLLQDATSALAVARGLDDLAAALVAAAARATNAAWTAVRIRAAGEAETGLAAQPVAAAVPGVPADAGSGPGAVPNMCTWGTLPPGFECPEGWTRDREPAVFRSPAELIGPSGRWAGPETEALVITPIVADTDSAGRVLGEVISGFRRPRSLEPHELDTLRALCAQAERVIEHVQLQERMRHRALHDSLTGLPNRALCAERLEQDLAHAARTGAPCAVLFIDLDGFKAINDASGHHVGDEVLRVVADRLRKSCRAEDTVSRLGGDEFVITAAEVSRQDAVALAERVRAAVRAELPGALRSERLSCSVGVLWWDPRREAAVPSVDELLNGADGAMYSAKRGGKDAVTLREWSPEPRA